MWPSGFPSSDYENFSNAGVRPTIRDPASSCSSQWADLSVRRVGREGARTLKQASKSILAVLRTV